MVIFIHNKSFPNSYRVRQGDIFDLSFIDESPVYKEIVDEIYRRADKDKTLAQKDPYKSILEGRIGTGSQSSSIDEPNIVNLNVWSEYLATVALNKTGANINDTDPITRKNGNISNPNRIPKRDNRVMKKWICGVLTKYARTK